MACRYLEHERHARVCKACEPQREPGRAEVKALCQADSQAECEFYRFRRATGRALLLEDFLAWQRKRASQPLEPGAGEPT
jgi:hypothetical protein